MGPQARPEHLAPMRDRYVGASRTEKGRVLTEAVTVTGYHRKAIIRAWRRPAVRPPRGPRRGRHTRYDAAVVRALRAVWVAAGYPWSRLRRYYDAPQTPLERVQACPQAHAAKVVALVRQRDRLDPFALAARIDRKLARVYALANHRRGLVPSTAGAAETHAKTARVSAALSLKDLSPSVTPNMARRRAAR